MKYFMRRRLFIVAALMLAAVLATFAPTSSPFAMPAMRCDALSAFGLNGMNPNQESGMESACLANCLGNDRATGKMSTAEPVGALILAMYAGRQLGVPALATSRPNANTVSHGGGPPRRILFCCFRE